MIRGKCPICGKGFEISKLGALPSFPFCTERCRLVDLGRWIDGAYAIPDKAQPGPDVVPEADDEDD